MRWLGMVVFAIGIALIGGCEPEKVDVMLDPSSVASDPNLLKPELTDPSQIKIVGGALAQLEKPAHYDASYRSLTYPGGDVPADRGACTDVVIRALRNAGFDLQVLVHRDMKSHFSLYPRRGSKPDTNIDHRRVPNLRVFFSRFGKSLSVSKDWQPGDIVSWKLDSGLDHIGVLVDEKGGGGDWLVVHNLSQTAKQDVLHGWKITGHYRYPKR